MPTITLNDDKGAIHVAWDMWGKGAYKGFSYQLDSGQSVNIILDKIDRTLNYGWDMWGRNEARSFSYKLESGESVNINLFKSGNMLNCGFPNLYIIDKSNIPALKTWWQDEESKMEK